MGQPFEPAIYRPEFANTIVPPNGTFPFYFSQNPSILPGISDKTLSIISPFVAYWVYSLLFHALDTWGANSAWLDRYRIHESAEVRSRNLVTKWQVVLAVLLQQVFQTILGVLFVEGEESASVDHTAKMTGLSPILVQSTLLWLGNPYVAQARLEYWGSTALHFIYWWAIPTAQILFAL
jgi:sphinganine C4-monooxygenase